MKLDLCRMRTISATACSDPQEQFPFIVNIACSLLPLLRPIFYYAGLLKESDWTPLPMPLPTGRLWGLLRRPVCSCGSCGSTEAFSRFSLHKRSQLFALEDAGGRKYTSLRAQGLRCMSILNSRNRPARLRIRVRRNNWCSLLVQCF